jgi:PAS domain S-box-containing protein
VRKKAKPLQGVSLELGAAADSVEAMGDLLSSVVEAAGGKAGVLATWGGGPSRLSSYNLDDDATETLGKLVATSPQDSETMARLQSNLREAAERSGLGQMQVLALPVRAHDRSIGVLCLLHPSNAANLLGDQPGVYNVLLDHVELVVQNARLLQGLLKERQWLEAMVQHTSHGIAIADSDGMVVGFNVAMERLSGWSLDEAVGHPMAQMFPLRREDAGAGLALVGSPDSTAEGQLQTRSGEWIDVEVSSNAVHDEGGHGSLGWVLSVRDIRSRKQKERLERIFLSAVSHELQTPIAIIKGFSGLLSDPEVPMTPAQMQEKAAIIFEESQRLERMVGQMLFATRLQAGGARLQMEPVAVEPLLRRLLTKLEPLASAARSTLTAELAPHLPLVTADPERLEQVARNLVENAIKYSPGRIVVSANTAHGELRICVTDEGAGIAAAERDRIFEAFERVPSGQTVAGSGLGLFICKAIVEAHGGHIWVEERQGGGSRFCFTLPLDGPPMLEEHRGQT